MKKNRKRIVHVVGTGTIGEPLIVLLCIMREELGIDEISFHKHRPLVDDRPKINNLVAKGAMLCVNKDVWGEFEKLNMKPVFTAEQALKRASVVIDCTSEGNANASKKIYEKYEVNTLGFIAQGSETNFGEPYAFMINDTEVFGGLSSPPKYVWIVSCNTHNIVVLTHTLALDRGAIDPDNLIEGDFTLFRRATDISQKGKFIASPEVDKHDSDEFGTHQAEDARILFKETMGFEPNLFSSAAKSNSQYMHVIRFSFRLKEKVTKEDIIRRIRDDYLIAVTEKKDVSRVFSFGRDQGHYGRILNQTVIPTETLSVAADGHRVIGWCFTPQDGNSLLSSTAAALALLDPKSYLEKMKLFMEPPFVFKEV